MSRDTVAPGNAAFSVGSRGYTDRETTSHLHTAFARGRHESTHAHHTVPEEGTRIGEESSQPEWTEIVTSAVNMDGIGSEDSNSTLFGGTFHDTVEHNATLSENTDWYTVPSRENLTTIVRNVTIAHLSPNTQDPSTRLGHSTSSLTAWPTMLGSGSSSADAPLISAHNTLRSIASYSTGALLHQQTPNATGVASGYSSLLVDNTHAGLNIYTDIPLRSTNFSVLLANDTNDTDTLGDNPMPSLISLNYSLPMMIVISVLLLTLVVITAFGNFLVGLSLFRFKNLRTVSNYLIGNLALSDFLLATTILPLSAVNEALGHWVFGKYICYAWLCVDVLYCTASIWNLCMIAFDRFTATLYPLWYREKRSAKQAAIYIALVWLLAIAVCMPPILGWNDISQTYSFDKELGVYQCMLFDNTTYVVYSASVSFYIPLFITTFLYVRIFIVLRMRMNAMRRVTKAQQCRPLLQRREEVSAQPSPIIAPKNTAIDTTEIELRPTAAIGNKATPIQPASAESSHHTSTEESSSKSARSSESGDETHPGGGVGNQCADSGIGRVTESDGLLSITQDKNSSTVTAAHSQPLVIFSTNHNHSPTPTMKSTALTEAANETRALLSHDTKMVKVIVSVENCNGKSTANNEAIKTIKSTAIKDSCTSTSKRNKRKKSRGNQNGTDEAINGSPGAADSGSNNNISHHFKLINLIRSPKTKRKSDGGVIPKRHRRQDRETKATIRMAIIIGFFCGFWIGFFTTYLLRGLVGNRFEIPRELDAIFFWLGYSNSAINPILYTIFNEDFRKAFQKILGCYRKARRSNGAGGYTRSRL